MIILITEICVRFHLPRQGEYAGLMTIRKFHKNNKQENRNVCLIPDSAHGTNPASAQMCGMKVVVVNCDEDGNVDIDDLKNKAEKINAKYIDLNFIVY